MKNIFSTAIIVGLLLNLAFAQRPEPANLPPGVKAYLSQARNSLDTDPTIQAAIQQDELNAFYTYLYSKPAIDYRDGHSTAWLVGYGIGESTGKSVQPYTIIAIITDAGDPIVRFPDPARNESLADSGYTDAVFVEMVSQKFILALATPNGRNTPGTIIVKQLSAALPTIFNYEPQDSPDQPLWDTTFYFTDTNGDGVKEMLVDRQSMFNGTTNREQLYFTFRPDTFTFEGTTVSTQSLANSIEAARQNPITPRLHQASRPFEATAFPPIPNMPTIASFTPQSASPGSTLTITGSKLSGTNDVIFPGGQRSIFNVASDTRITAEVPSTPATGRISLGTTYGFATTVSDFAIVPGPAINSFSPTSGFPGGSVAQAPGTRVTITGQRFTGTTNTRFAGIAGVNMTVDSDTQISVTVPGGAQTGKITVTTPSGTATSATDFTVVPRPPPPNEIPPTPTPDDS